MVRLEAGAAERSGDESRAVGAPTSAKAARFRRAPGPRGIYCEILGRMGIGPVEIRYVSRPEGEYLEVNGEHLAALIGRHGNTLEALNLLFNNAFNAGVRTNRHYYTIDAEGYRAHRADQLKNLALATLERCVRERTAQKLEPMLPSERKIIHLALATSELVRTESEGEEPERRVVIFPR